MDIQQAQSNMRSAYFGGGPGVAVSGLVWLAAGVVAMLHSPRTAMLTLFFGGMAIHPLGVLLTKLMGRSGQHQKGSPLAHLAMESTAILLLGVFIAFTAAQAKVEWFFPVMLIIIGGRYLLFQSMYGMRVYWTLGLVLAGAGVAAILTNPGIATTALLGGGIEVIAALFILLQQRQTQSASTAEQNNAG
ncbi:DUF7010 family protein [Permianibacter aggregans]|uniref:Uncharacterized protein n=1 Tax=Permianibacter aggregans TaxID=1510150 RepID=A0A4V6PWN8_9GAMM|nr:hypothetical protein [Permianibacter aggregans]QGX39221.1 hypothetical protein E2H98_05955 [Permianibacter aggregans]TDQ46027.1 hypothetical protein EV696_11521 [Permianibacter aggregans]